MNAEQHSLVEGIQHALSLLEKHLNLEKSLKRLGVLNQEAEDPELWSNPDKARAVMQERTQLEEALQVYKDMSGELQDTIELIEFSEEEGDSESLEELSSSLKVLAQKAEKKQLESLLSGEADRNDCYLSINAGAGGTEAQDWVLMLTRMYIRWCEAHKYKVEWLEELAGEEAGLKSATVRIKGVNAYGWLKTESGVHRLVRISPFDSQSRRHTSFASVWISPVIDASIDLDIQEKDLRIDTYRASGAGGQHVNTTDSAVRITHLPTSIVVQCQNDRSQHRNKAQALDMLKSRLYEFELKKREEEAQAEQSSKTEIGWGNQIRSYVLHPYQMIKDLRTAVETGNSKAVLDGDIDLFLEASLAQKLGSSD